MARKRYDAYGDVREPNRDFSKMKENFVKAVVTVNGKPREVLARLRRPTFNGAGLEIYGRFGKDERDRTITCAGIRLRGPEDARRLFGRVPDHPFVQIGPA